MSDKKILFVVMPWHSVHYGSLGVGVLTSIARRHPTADRICVDTLYASLRWAAYLAANTDGELDSKAYAHLGEDLFFQAVGDWIFAPAFHQSPEWGVNAFKQQFRGAADDFEMAVRAHRLSRPFVEDLAAEIVAASPDVVGLTSVFQQNMACLALARRVKELAPHITIIMGGANCDGPQGPALHRIYPFLDIVFSGESDLSFPVYLDYLDGTLPLKDVPGITWREADGQSMTNRRVQLPKGNELVAPDHDDYFDQAMSSPIAAEIEPNIVAESARGCWWGQKHHCTFCGLNGMGMTFRSKPADAFLEELERLVVRHQSLDVILADNILDMDYLRSVVPAIAAKGWDLRLHYEIKANLSYEQLEALREAGIVHIQPGIESLSTRVLQLMQKGISGPQNVRVLRDCEELNLTTTWNLLGGFPGEEEADYRPVIEQMAALVHLPPPSGTARLSLERFSPFFDKPSMGFGARRPAEHYRTIYNLPDADLMDILYIFESDPQGVTDAVLDEMELAVEAWKASYHAGGTLIMTDVGGTLTISDTRSNWPRRDYQLHGLEAELYRSLRRPLGENALIEIGSRLHGGDGERMALAALVRFRKAGLVFTDNKVSVALATQPIPFRLRLAA